MHFENILLKLGSNQTNLVQLQIYIQRCVVRRIKNTILSIVNEYNGFTVLALWQMSNHGVAC